MAGKDWRNYLYFRGQLSYNGNNDVSKSDHESILDFKGKVVKPFVTHEGSGFGKSKKQLKNHLKK